MAMRHAVAGAEDADVDRYLRAIEQRADSIGAPFHKLTEKFIAAAASFTRRHAIDYRTWLEIGVPVAVLRAAGLCPTAHTPQSVLTASTTPSRCDRRRRSHS